MCVYLMILGFVGQTPAPKSPTAPAVTPTQAFELLETESRKVAYVEHTGSYWSLGPVIDAVARDAKAMGIRGQLVIRYLDDPATPPGTVHAQVGFELRGSEVPKDPYQFATWPPSLVASKSVPGSDGLSPRHFSAMKLWVAKEGLVPAGDLIALVELAENGESTSIDRAEIQVPVCMPDPPVMQAAPQPGSTEPATTTVQADVPGSKITKIIQMPIPSAKEQDKATQEAAPLQTPGATPMVQQSSPLPSDPKNVEAAVPVRLWLEDGKFSELAAAILPPNADAASKQWAEDVIGRVIALANGARKMAPGEEGWLAPLAAELGARRDASRTAAPKAARKVIGPAGPVGNKGPERKHVMMELDRLMASLAYGSLTPAQVREKLTEILEVVPTLVILQ